MSKQSTDNINEIIQIAVDLQKPRRKAPVNPFSKRLGPIIKSPEGKDFLIRLMDVAFRSKDYARVSTFVHRLFKSTDAHKALFSTQEKALVRLFNVIGYKLPSVSVPLMLRQIQEVTKPVVFFTGGSKYKEHYYTRKKEGIKLNVNLIGEALIGEEEAQRRIESYCELLNQNEVDYISIKISTIYSQIDSLAHDEVVKILVEKLSIIYREVLRIEKNTGVQKFINLDMEEYRDLSMTIATFKQTLDLPEFKTIRAGIVLQAYLPDCYNEAFGLKTWAQERVKAGGVPVKVRIVKGANQEMELTEASMRDWPCATYATKLETDASYKKVISLLLEPENVSCLNVGVASHNVFDLAYAIDLVEKYDVSKYVDFEMLEGVAIGTVKEISSRKYNVLLYTPIVKKEDYNNAIAYLVRRLDEGTQSGNFLREGFDLDVNSEKWNELKTHFMKSVELMDTVRITQNRTQNRNEETYEVQTEFENVADTDWVLEENRAWAHAIKERWKQPKDIMGHVIRVVGGQETHVQENIFLKNWNGDLPWSYEIASVDDYQYFLDRSSDWYGLSSEEKALILRKAAVCMAKKRGDLIGVAVEELGKTVAEVDVEVSEAIDFANYYAQSLLDIEDDKIEFECSGVNLVLSPWNFPVAIPIGGVLASLAAGKRVILKPSQNAAATAYLISECLWEAGVPESAFAFLPTKEGNLDGFLTEGNVFDAVILTGGTSTAQFLLNRNPSLNLYAETGGKNVTIVTALSDRDQAIKNVIQSAFGNTGQKCSATSLLLLEKEVFNDEHFKALLKDAVESKIVGQPWDLRTQVGPLAVPVNDNIRKVINETPDEDWLVKPVLEGEFLLSLGVKWGVQANNFGVREELFGPILMVMEIDGLHDAITFVNSLDYGLTSGIETLAREELTYWKNNIMAGNLYANRSTTGAIVQRQPFGGMKASCFGFGMKAGGKNYVLQFMNLKTSEVKVEELIENYRSIYLNYFNQEIDYSAIRGQHNKTRYLKPKTILVLLDEYTSAFEVHSVLAVAAVLRIQPAFFALSELAIAKELEIDITVLPAFTGLLGMLDYDTVVRNLCKSIDDDFAKVMHLKNLHLYSRPVHENGRVEFLNYLKEQSLSINFHRYGNQMGETSGN